MKFPKRNANINTQDYKGFMEWIVFDYRYKLGFWSQNFLSSKSDSETLPTVNHRSWASYVVLPLL